MVVRRSKTKYLCVNERETHVAVKMQGVLVANVNEFNTWGQSFKVEDKVQER